MKNNKETGFKRLQVWQRSRDIAVKVYKLAQTTELKTDRGLKDQICRSAVSIPSNIAEGFDRDFEKEFARFLTISKGSLAELRTQIDIAQQIGYIAEVQFQDLDEELVEIGKMLGALIKSKRSKGSQ